MTTTARRTVSLDDLPKVLKRLSREPISAEVVQRRRRLSAEGNKVVDEMEPLAEDAKDVIRQQRGEKLIG